MAKPLIARETMLETALILLDSEGLRALNARNLAAALGCSTRTLYQQMGRREDWVRELVRYHFAQIVLDFTRHPRWQDSVLDWAWAMRRALMARPALARLMTVEDRPVVVAYVDQLLKVLMQAGMSRVAAVRSCRVFIHTVMTLTLTELNAGEGPQRQSGPYFQDPASVFDTSLRWLVVGCEAELGGNADDDPLNSA